MVNELKRCRRTDSDFYDDSDEEGYTPVRRKSYQTRTPKPPARRGRPPNSAKDKMAVSEQPKTTSPKRKALPRDNSNLRVKILIIDINFLKYFLAKQSRSSIRCLQSKKTQFSSNSSIRTRLVNEKRRNQICY
jgi:hypothetical protein